MSSIERKDEVEICRTNESESPFQVLRATGGANLFVHALTAYSPAPLPMPLDRSAGPGPVSCKLLEWRGSTVVRPSSYGNDEQAFFECQAVLAISLQRLSSSSRGPDRPCMSLAMELLISC